MKNNTIKIIFTNSKHQINSNSICLNTKAKEFLKNDHTVKYSDNSKLRNLFIYIARQTNPPQIAFSDEYLEGLISGRIERQFYVLNMDFLLSEYIKQNAVKNKLYFQYSIGIGAGWSGNINDCIRIYINNDESKHQNIDEQHVHIQKGNYHKNKLKSRKDAGRSSSHENTIRMSLIDGSIMDNADIHKKGFSGKEIKRIREFVMKNKQIFIDNLNMLRRGAKPIEAWLDYNGRSIKFY